MNVLRMLWLARKEQTNEQKINSEILLINHFLYQTISWFYDFQFLFPSDVMLPLFMEIFHWLWCKQGEDWFKSPVIRNISLLAIHRNILKTWWITVLWKHQLNIDSEKQVNYWKNSEIIQDVTVLLYKFWSESFQQIGCEELIF